MMFSPLFYGIVIQQLTEKLFEKTGAIVPNTTGNYAIFLSVL